MNTQTLHIEFEHAEGAILRLLGLVERRGFEVCTMNLPRQREGRMNLDISLIAREAGRDIGVLRRQIYRLTGVRRVLGGVVHDTEHYGGRNDQG